MNQKNEVFILQVRPIISVTDKSAIKDNKLVINKLYEFFIKVLKILHLAFVASH